MSSLKSNGNTRSDLAHMVKKIAKHCKDNKVQSLIFYESGPVGQVAINGFYSPEMIKSLVVNLCISHGSIVQDGLDEFAKIAQMVKEKQAQADGDNTGAGGDGNGEDVQRDAGVLEAPPDQLPVVP